MDDRLDAAAWEVAALAAQAQLELDELLATNRLTQAAVLAIQERFADAFVDLMVRELNAAAQAGAAAGGRAAMGNAFDVRAVRSMPVGEVSLSQRLYAHGRQTVGEVTAIVRQHAQGVQQARELAMRLYDGYDPQGAAARPLEGRARAALPKALRNLTQNATDRASLQRVLDQGLRYANTLKTAPLRAAYALAFEQWAKQGGQQVLQRRLEVAHKEKTRYMANRIAQTELARTYQHALADELLADDSIGVVQVVLSGSHPRADICDLHARANLFGLGPGCYPKARAPRPTYHPFCRCRLRSRPDLSAANARETPGGEAAYLRSLPSYAEAARVMGSRAKLQAVLNGDDALGVANAGVVKGYETVRLGDTVGMRTFRQPSESFGPYDPGAPRVSPDVSTPARAAAVRIEDAIRRDRLETGVFIGADGRELARRTGAQDEVRFPEGVLSRCAGSTFTHNHPGGAGFSVADVATASEFGFGELRAVTADFRHIIRGIPSASASQWQQRYDLAQDAELPGLYELVRLGQLHHADFGREARHRAWAKLAREMGFSYNRERS